MLILLFSWRFVAVVVLLVAAKYAYTKVRHHRLARKWETQKIHDHREWWQTLPILFDNSIDTSSGYFLQGVHQRFGLANAFSLAIPGKQIIISQSPKVMKAMFLTQFSDFNLGVRVPAFAPLLGNGIFASEGLQWKHSRNLLKPQFVREQVGHVEMLEPHVKLMIEHIRRNSGSEFDLEHLFYAFTLDAATHFLFGESTDVLGEKGGNVAFDKSLQYVGEYLAKRLSLFDFYWVANNKGFRDNIKQIHDYTQQFVDKALDLKPEEIELKANSGYTFLYELVKHTRNPVEIRDELLNIMIAGRATTALLLLSVFMELGRNPRVWASLREEVQRHFGGGEPITFESLKRCTYLKWVINETLRLWPPVALNLREAERDTSIPEGGGPDGLSPVFCPKGSIIVVMLFSIHRLEQYYGLNANDFVPERWLGLSKIGWAFMPFGSGPRVCLGQQFALTEVLYVYVRLAQAFETLDYRGEYPPRILANAVLKYKEGVPLRMG